MSCPLTPRPTAREIFIENLCEHTVYVVPKLTVPIPGLSLQFEKENPNGDLLNCAIFH